MSTPVRFWIDPLCPFCWTTALWVRDIASERDLEITWQPISLLVKNGIGEDSPWYGVAKWSFGLLRVLESVRAAEGNAAVESLYIEYGRRIHHDGQNEWPVADALEAVGLPVSHAAAFDDDSWDAEVLRLHHEGLALVGNDVGTPIITFHPGTDREASFFGPVIARIPRGNEALRLWDAIEVIATTSGMAELKRSLRSKPIFD